MDGIEGELAVDFDDEPVLLGLPYNAAWAALLADPQSTQNVDVIPGTNIPRPVLNTKITPSKSININSKSRNNSSLKVKQQSDIPSRSILDMKWVQFMKHPDERIVKAGIVDVSREKTSHFEKKYRGMLAESPLGYRNRDNIAATFPHHNLFSSDDAESIIFREPHVDIESEEEEEDRSTMSSSNSSKILKDCNAL